MTDELPDVRGGTGLVEATPVVPVDSAGNPVQLDPLLAFSTTALLANGATYDAGYVDARNFTQVQTSALSNVDGTITVDFCQDSGGTDILRTLVIPYTGGSGFQMFSAPAFTPYIRYRFTADAAGQTDFYFDTKLLKTALSPQVLGLDAFISPKMVSTLGRSILVGRTEGGDSYQNVAIDSQANLEIAIKSPRTAFGEINVADTTPVIQVDFVYGLSDITMKTAVTGSASTPTVTSGLLSVATSANASSSAVAYTARNLKYRPGQGALVRFTAIFTTGVANSSQYAGTGFSDLDDGIFFGYDGATFGLCTVKGGTETWVPRTSWNVDVMNGAGGATNPSGMTLDPTQGNVYQIKYQYLGFGALYFYVEDSETGDFRLVHIIKYANTNTTPSLTNPSMPILWAAVNTSNTSNIVVKAASCMAGVEGPREFLGPRHGTVSEDTTVTTEQVAFSIKNCTTYNGVNNGGQVRIRQVSFGSNTGGAGSGVSYLRLIKDVTTIGGSPSYSPYDGSTGDNGATLTSANSIVSIDTAGTTISGGNIEYSAIVAVGNSMAADVTDLGIYIAPGEILTFSIESTQSATVGVGVTWAEDI